MDARFIGTSLITHDVAALAAFYATVLDLPVRGDGEFAAIRTTGGTLSICSIDGMRRLAPDSLATSESTVTVVEFEVDDVDGCFTQLAAAGVPVVKPPETYPWGRRSAWFRDPDGAVVNLCQRVPPPADPTVIVRTYLHRLLVERDLTACDDLLADTYVDHDAPTGTAPGPQATRTYVSGLLRDYPDLRFIMDQIVSLGRQVAVRATWHGTHHQTGVVLRRGGLLLMGVDDDRIVERTSVYDDVDTDAAPPAGSGA